MKTSYLWLALPCKCLSGYLSRGFSLNAVITVLNIGYD
uniref:Uncharacterized protein n=1 Tax=Rhizophora mucronata TaxID=61149 RepID=A0A2P2P5N1_RHIMU